MEGSICKIGSTSTPLPVGESQPTCGPLEYYPVSIRTLGTVPSYIRPRFSVPGLPAKPCTHRSSHALFTSFEFEFVNTAMELSSSVASTAAQARLLRLPSRRRSALPGCISFRHCNVRSQQMKLTPAIGATFQQTFAQTVKEKKKQNVPCYQRQKAPQIEAKSMDEVYDDLAEHLLSVLEKTEHVDSKYIVGVAGPPGAGKSTVASEVIRRVNMLWSKKHAKHTATEEIAAMLPMDGFHLYRSQLDAMEDPKEAHARRGAPWTFSPSLLLKCLQTLRTEGSVCAPSFDHGVGDPVDNDISVKSHIVLAGTK